MKLFKRNGFLICWLLAAVVSMTVVLPVAAQSTTTYTPENDMLKFSNDVYEIAFNAADGGIAYIIDKATSQQVSDGTVGSNLWSAVLENGDVIDSSTYGDQFTYAWDEASATLTLTYAGDVGVLVTVNASGDHGLKMQASVSNGTGANISDFQFPAQLKIGKADVQDSLLPMIPGVLVNSEFFTGGRSFLNEYPGVMFADYLALRSAKGNLAVYSQRGAAVQPVLLGYIGDDPDYSLLTHKFQTWISDATTWASPAVVINVGQDYPATILNYRDDNGIGEYKSLTEKLGDSAQTFFEAPMYKLDTAALRMKFSDVQTSILDHLNIPGIIHFVAFQPRGHDKNYPDFIPPDTKWGTTEDFVSLIGAVHDEGSLAVPYTNFSWWDFNGPTLGHLPTDVPLNTVVDIKDSHGLPGFESYGPNSGFVMNLHNNFTRDKISEQHDILMNTLGMDGIFEDQWGIRSAPYDFNPAGLETFDPSTSYYEGILGHYRDHAANNLMTECGVDVLAENGVAFMGTNYLWDMLGYRGDTADVTTYYPMAGMLLRDKVLLYQHNLAAETWTKNKEMLRWNLAQGYALSNAFLDGNTGGLNMNNPWLNLVGVFQKYALANYADELVTSYADLDDNTSETVFGSYTVIANWDAENPYLVGGYTVAPGGVMTQANNGSVTAGVFTTYNDNFLSDGDHYLVEVRGAEGIKVFQPVGEDTELHIQKDAAWSDVVVTAYGYDGEALGTAEATLNGDDVQFTYAGQIDGKIVGYYEIAPAG